MTEEEAKTKICCASFSPVAFARMDMGSVEQGIEPRKCIGSACMAWRWDGWEYADLPVGMDAPKGYEKAGEPRGEGGALTHRQNWRRRANGFCGLAGKP